MIESDLKLDVRKFENAKITGINIDSLSTDEMEVLFTQIKYCQGMVDADIETMNEIVPSDVTFTHMSGMKQSRDEYFDDIKNGRLNYYNITIENPVIDVIGNTATIDYTSVLDANAYGAKGVYRMYGVHKFKKVDGKWYASN